MVNTSRLEQLLNLSAKTAEGAAKPASGTSVVRRNNLAVSGVREARQQAQGRALSAAEQARIDASWDALSPVQPDTTVPARQRQFNQMARAEAITSGFDVLRAQLSQTFRKRDMRVLGICSPRSGAGASFTAAGLLASFARRRVQRVVGLDLSLPNPSLHRYFEVQSTASILPLIEGDVPVESHLLRATPKLALGLGARQADLMGSVIPSHGLAGALLSIQNVLAPEIVICDLPPLLEGDASLSMLPCLDAVLLVADARRTKASDIAACERSLSDQATLLGVVLNHHAPARGGV